MVKKTTTVEYQESFTDPDRPTLKACVLYEGEDSLVRLNTPTSAFLTMSFEQFESLSKFVEQCRMEQDAQ